MSRRAYSLVIGLLVFLVCGAASFGDASQNAASALTGLAPLTFDSASSVESWTFSDGPEWPGAVGKLSWSADEGRAAPGAARLDFDFGRGGNYVAAIVKLPSEPAVEVVRLWLKKPGSNLVILRAADSEGQTFQKDLRYTFPGWQQIEVELGGWGFHWGGRNDGVIRGPYREFHVLIERDGDQKSGTMYIDDVELLTEAAASPARITTTEYVAADFDTNVWTPDGGTGATYRDRTWHYVLRDKSGRAMLHREFSLLGRPQSMKVTVESDGSGHDLAVVLGSHFQMFEKTLGSLSREGPMQFDARMGDLKDWRHYGGENDGLVRLPFRVLGLVIVKKGASDRGTLRPSRIEVATEHESDRAVEVIPAVRREGDQALFAVQTRSLLADPVEAKLHWSIYEGDRRRRGGVIDMSLPARGKPVEVKRSEPVGSARVLEGRFQLEVPGQQCGQRSCTLAAVPPQPGSARLDPESRMGAGLYLYRFHGQPDYQRKLEQMCDLASRAGVKWTREEFHWNWIETAKGQYDWSYFDDLVNTAAKHGISVYGLMCYWTEWTEPNTERGMEDYCDYLATAVERYRDRVHHWEIWNEPNVFFWSGTRKQYVQLLKRAYETVKRVDPDAQVLGCSTAGIDTSFIQFVLDHGGPMDALTVHPYRGELNSEGFIRELRAIRDVAGGRDVWITEMGWPSNIGGLTERQQAGYVARTYLSAFASNAVRSVSWYDFREDGEDPFYNEHHFGLVRNQDLAPKMGYAALATVGRLFDGLRCTRTLDLGPDLEGYVFADEERQIVAVWTTGPTRLISLDVSDSGVEVLDLAGGAVEIDAAAQRKSLVLQSGQPVYLRGRPGFEVRRSDPPVRATVSAPATHPGDSVTVDVTAQDAIRRIEWTLPPAWPQPHALPGQEPGGSTARFTIPVPASAAAEPHVLTATVETTSGQRWEIPVTITIVPTTLRV